MKVVILFGGLGTRLKEETEYRPKPMVNVMTVSPKENLYGAELQSVCYRGAQDEQQKNCVDREENSGGERIDGRELCVVRPLKHRGFSGSMSSGMGFLLKMQVETNDYFNKLYNSKEYFIRHKNQNYKIKYRKSS